MDKGDFAHKKKIISQQKKYKDVKKEQGRVYMYVCIYVEKAESQMESEARSCSSSRRI